MPMATVATMNTFGSSQGVPRSFVIHVSKSTNTWENALYTEPLLSGSTRGNMPLTSDFRMSRARWAVQKVSLSGAKGAKGAKSPATTGSALHKRASMWKGRWPAFSL